MARYNFSKQVATLIIKDREPNFTNVRDLLCYEDMCPSAACPFEKKGDLSCGNILATMVLTNKVKHVIMGD